MMSRQSLKRAAVGATALGLLASTAWAQQWDLREAASARHRMAGTQRWLLPAQQSRERQPQAEELERPRAPEQPLSTTTSMVNLPVHDMDGRQVGSVRYIMLDARNGEVLYALSLQAGRWISLIPAGRAGPNRRGAEPGPHVKKSADALTPAPPLSRHRLSGVTQLGWHVGRGR